MNLDRSASWLTLPEGATCTMERFAAADFGPVEIEGLTLHRRLKVPIAAKDVSRPLVRGDSPRRLGFGLPFRLPGVPGARGGGGKVEVDGRSNHTWYPWPTARFEALARSV
jgi:hypothetical protein